MSKKNIEQIIIKGHHTQHSVFVVSYLISNINQIDPFETCFEEHHKTIKTNILIIQYKQY
jgi:hypothetical protein